MSLQVRETETWMPPKAGQSNDDMDSSGDFIFPNEDSTTVDDEDDDNYPDLDDISGSGDDTSLVDEDLDIIGVGEYSHTVYNYWYIQVLN